MDGKEEIERKLRSVQEELDTCLTMLKPFELEDSHLLPESICEGISHIAVALLHFEKTKSTLKEPLQQKCSFCRKTQQQVSTLIQGPSVCICDECIDLCGQKVASGNSKVE